PLARAAGELAERHALRGYDAVHLASALAIEDEGLVVATWDRDLATAALAPHRPVVPGQAGRAAVRRMPGWPATFRCPTCPAARRSPPRPQASRQTRQLA